MIEKRQGASPRAVPHSDNKLFRTSTTYLLDPTEALEPETIASFANNSQKHVAYFAKGKPEEFQLVDAKVATLEEVQQGQKMIESLLNTPKNEANHQITHRKSKRKENRLPTSKNFAQITNVLREAVAGHKFMKEKLRQIKIQQQKEKPISPRNQRTHRKDRGSVFSISPSPLSSPRHLPPSPRSPHSQRYQVAGNMAERYNKRQTEMAELIQQYKMMKTSKQSEECPFQPRLPAKAKNRRILDKREEIIRASQDRKFWDEEVGGVFIKIHNKQMFAQPKRSPFKFQDFKTLIKFELERIPLEKRRDTITH